MKKVWGLLFICIFAGMKGLAFEDYIVLSDKPVRKIVTSNPDIITANILVTIMNEKNTIIIHSKEKGKAFLTFTIGEEEIKIPVEVKDNKTVFKKYNGLEFIKMDIPPQGFDIDLPPALGGKS